MLHQPRRKNVNFHNHHLNKVSIIKFFDLVGFNLKSHKKISDFILSKGDNFSSCDEFLNKEKTFESAA